MGKCNCLRWVILSSTEFDPDLFSSIRYLKHPKNTSGQVDFYSSPYMFNALFNSSPIRKSDKTTHAMSFMVLRISIKNIDSIYLCNMQSITKDRIFIVMKLKTEQEINRTALDEENLLTPIASTKHSALVLFLVALVSSWKSNNSKKKQTCLHDL